MFKSDKVNKKLCISRFFKSDKVNKRLCIGRFLGVIKAIQSCVYFFLSSILIEEVRTKISYFFRKCTLKKTKQKK